MRVRVRADEAERRLRTVGADAAILKSKQAAMVERENFLLSEMRRLSEHLLCKFSFCASLCACLLLVLPRRNSTGTQLDPGAEAKRVTFKLNTLADLASRGAPGFWSDRDRSHVLVTLQDRVEQVGMFVKSCRSALELIFRSLFSLNPAPRSLADLMKKFHRGEAIEDFVRAQLVAGARFSLALVVIHHPLIDLEAIAKGPPSGFDVDKTLLDPFYAIADGPAEGLVELLEYETRAELHRRRDQLLAFSLCICCTL